MTHPKTLISAPAPATLLPDAQAWVNQVLEATSTLRVTIDSNQRVPVHVRACALACIRTGIDMLKQWDGK